MIHEKTFACADLVTYSDMDDDGTLQPALGGGDVQWSLGRDQLIAAVQGCSVVLWDVRSPGKPVGTAPAASREGTVTSVDWSPW
jgi:hypothetical protein